MVKFINFEKLSDVTVCKILRSNFCNIYDIYVSTYVCPSVRRTLSNPKPNKFFLMKNLEKTEQKTFFFGKSSALWRIICQLFLNFCSSSAKNPPKIAQPPKFGGNLAKKNITLKYFLCLHAIFFVNFCYTTLYRLDLFGFGPKFGLLHYKRVKSGRLGGPPHM